MSKSSALLICLFIVALKILTSAQYTSHSHHNYATNNDNINAFQPNSLSQQDWSQLHNLIDSQITGATGFQGSAPSYGHAQTQQQAAAALSASPSASPSQSHTQAQQPIVRSVREMSVSEQEQDSANNDEGRVVPFVVKQCCNSQPNILTVQGKGNVRYNTTLARITLGAEHEGVNESSAEVMAVVARNAAAAVAALKSMGVRELKTNSVGLNPTYTYPQSGPPKVTGYHASLTVSYLIDIDRAGESIDAAVSAGASTVQSVNFEAEPDVVEDARKQALIDAVNDANEQADAVLTTLNYKRGVPSSIDLEYVSPPPPSPLMVNLASAPFARMAMSAASIPIQGGPQEVTSSVQIKYNIDFGKPVASASASASSPSLAGSQD